MGLMLVNRKLENWGRWIALWGGLLFVLTMMCLAYYFAIYVACPAQNGDCDRLSIWGNILFFMVLLNLMMFQYFSRQNRVSHWQRQSCVADLCRKSQDEETSLIRRTLETTVDMESESNSSNEPMCRFCHECNRDMPLRSHHCPLCNICVLRKDHHCFVTGACVGLGNQRYFMTFLFWCVLGLISAVYWIGPHLVNVHGVDGWFGYFKMLGPVAVASYFFGYCDLFTAFNSSVFTFCVVCIFSAGAFLVMQLYYTSHGYTMYEYHTASMYECFEGDGHNLGERFRLVFGRNWALNFLFPMFWEQPVLTQEIANNLFRVRSKLL